MNDSFPLDRPAFDRWSERLRKPSVVHEIPALMAAECRCLVVAYYGSWPRALWEIGKHHLVMDLWGFYWSCVYRFCDLMRWTALRPIPAVPGHFWRHARQCDRSNCNNVDCVRGGIPAWFRKLSGMTRYE